MREHPWEGRAWIGRLEGGEFTPPPLPSSQSDLLSLSSFNASAIPAKLQADAALVKLAARKVATTGAATKQTLVNAAVIDKAGGLDALGRQAQAKTGAGFGAFKGKNVVVFMSDQESNALEFMPPGWEAANLPGKTRLRQNGIEFERAYASSSMCTAARAVFFTGACRDRLIRKSGGRLRRDKRKALPPPPPPPPLFHRLLHHPKQRALGAGAAHAGGPVPAAWRVGRSAQLGDSGQGGRLRGRLQRQDASGQAREPGLYVVVGGRHEIRLQAVVSLRKKGEKRRGGLINPFPTVKEYHIPSSPPTVQQELPRFRGQSVRSTRRGKRRNEGL